MLRQAQHDVRSKIQVITALRAHAAKPSPEVVKRRLEALDADLPRRREFTAQMEAEAAAQRGHHRFDGDRDWSNLFGSGTNPVRAVLLALLIFAWMQRARSPAAL